MSDSEKNKVYIKRMSDSEKNALTYQFAACKDQKELLEKNLKELIKIGYISLDDLQESYTKLRVCEWMVLKKLSYEYEKNPDKKN
jgi:hypothetical protein